MQKGLYHRAGELREKASCSRINRRLGPHDNSFLQSMESIVTFCSALLYFSLITFLVPRLLQWHGSFKRGNGDC